MGNMIEVELSGAGLPAHEWAVVAARAPAFLLPVTPLRRGAGGADGARCAGRAGEPGSIGVLDGVGSVRCAGSADAAGSAGETCGALGVRGALLYATEGFVPFARAFDGVALDGDAGAGGVSDGCLRGAGAQGVDGVSDGGLRGAGGVSGIAHVACAGGVAGGGVTLDGVFAALRGYIRCLAAARDALLAPELVGDDPETGVFVRPVDVCSERAVPGGAGAYPVRVVYGVPGEADEVRKLARLASFLATRPALEGVMGAQACLEQFAAQLRARRPALRECQRLTESIQREWNHISG